MEIRRTDLKPLHVAIRPASLLLVQGAASSKIQTTGMHVDRRDNDASAPLGNMSSTPETYEKQGNILGYQQQSKSGLFVKCRHIRWTRGVPFSFHDNVQPACRRPFSIINESTIFTGEQMP